MEVAVGWDEDAGLALDGLDEEGRGVRRDGCVESGSIAEGNGLEAGEMGPKPSRY